jgi:hypothetical protein
LRLRGRDTLLSITMQGSPWSSFSKGFKFITVFSHHNVWPATEIALHKCAQWGHHMSWPHLTNLRRAEIATKNSKNWKIATHSNASKDLHLFNQTMPIAYHASKVVTDVTMGKGICEFCSCEKKIVMPVSEETLSCS